MKIDQMKRIFRSRLVNSSWLALSALILFSAVETPAGTNTLEKVERAETVQISQTSSPDQEKIKAEIFEFIDAWGKAWSPKENAPQFSRTLIAPFYLQSEELLGFDFTDAESRTVFQGVQIHHDTWEAFVRGYDYWTFTPVTESIRIYPQSDRAAAVTLYVDNQGQKSDGTEFHARAHATLLLEKHNGNWVIVHENIWGPVNE